MRKVVGSAHTQGRRDAFLGKLFEKSFPKTLQKLSSGFIYVTLAGSANTVLPAFVWRKGKCSNGILPSANICFRSFRTYTG